MTTHPFDSVFAGLFAPVDQVSDTLRIVTDCATESAETAVGEAACVGSNPCRLDSSLEVSDAVN